MDDEDGGPARASLPEVFRRVLERLDRFAPLPPGTRFLRTLGPGTPGSQAVSIAEREPATDVIEGPHTIFVTVELPGVSRKDIDLHATETTLVVSANSPSWKYYREIPLPAPVCVDVITATYKNGVLDVSLEKRDKTWRIPVN